ncbi:MAG: hypothetical protein VR70_10795 [Rhodospirillaceae bacterium BRH_c57]|nr:MAG: hypothetical protein VR70_10795 [Rhodospirillaceae bacterium BRH_c57]
MLERVKARCVQVTTAPTLEGFRITSTIDIVSSECALGMNVLKDFLVGLSDFFGGRNETIQNELRHARQVCVDQLRYEAHMVGANAVVGCSLSYSEFSGKGTSMLFIVAAGTAVTVEPLACTVGTR